MTQSALIGTILIAPPAVKGNFWHKTVVMITDHYTEGSVGIVVNKRSHVSINELGKKLGIDIDTPGFVYQGGPINTTRMTLLHTNDWVSKNTMQVGRHFSISSADDILPRIAHGDTPERWRLFFGTCGWSPNQLISEIRGTTPSRHNTSWCIAHSDLDLVFGTDNKEQWCACLDRAALEFAQTALA